MDNRFRGLGIVATLIAVSCFLTAAMEIIADETKVALGLAGYGAICVCAAYIALSGVSEEKSK